MALLRPFAIFKHETEVALSTGMSLDGCLPVPPDGLAMVLLHPVALLVKPRFNWA
jgi:hypothetical protein